MEKTNEKQNYMTVDDHEEMNVNEVVDNENDTEGDDLDVEDVEHDGQKDDKPPLQRQSSSDSAHGLDVYMENLGHEANFDDFLRAQRARRHCSFRLSNNRGGGSNMRLSNTGHSGRNLSPRCAITEEQRNQQHSARKIMHQENNGQVPVEDLEDSEVNGAQSKNDHNCHSPATNNKHQGSTTSATPGTEEDIEDEMREKAQRYQTLRSLSVLGNRSSVATSKAKDEWQHMLREFDALDIHLDEEGEDEHPHVLPFYSPPVQRQRWGQDQMLPHINWGDLFFDLFYVAAAYNLGNMLISAMNPDDYGRGIIYFVGIFGPLYNTWECSIFYSSRYTTVDYSHRLFEVVRFLFVTFAVLHIKSIDLLGDPKSAETFSLTLAIFLESIMHLLLNVELYYKGLGDKKAIQSHTERKIQFQLIPLSAAYLAAVIVAGVQFFGHDDASGGYESYDKDSYKDTGSHSYNDGAYENSVDYQNSTSPAIYGAEDNDYRRMLAGSDEEGHGYEEAAYDKYSSPKWAISDLALTLTALAYLMNIFFTAIRKLRVTSGGAGNDIRESFVPNNIDYLIHRYGEWCMLMIGESVLSLLIVTTTESPRYYLIATVGALVIVVLQALKYESEPSHAHGHALFQNIRNGMCYGYVIQILSMGLIALGISFKIFLYQTVSEEEGDYGDGRRLAPKASVSEEAAAALFTAALSLVLVSLEVILLTHNGVQNAYGHLFLKGSKEDQILGIKKPNWPMIMICLVKITVLMFAVTLNQWTTDQVVLTLCGFAIMTTMALTRILGWGFVHHKQAIDDFVAGVGDSIHGNLSVIGGSTHEAARGVTKTIKKAVSFMPGESVASVDSRYSRNSKMKFGLERSKTGEKDGSVQSDAKDSVSTHKTNDAYDIDESFDSIIVADLKGIMRKVNETTLAMFGYASKAELVGKNLSMLVGGNEAASHDHYMKGFVSTGKQSAVLGKQRKVHAKRADGSEFPCLIGIRQSKDGKRLVGYIRDVTDVVKQAVSVSITNMQMLDPLAQYVRDDSFDAIVAIDKFGIIQRVNETAVHEFGYESKEDMEGQNISVLVGGEHGPNHDHYMAAYRKRGELKGSVLGKQRLLHAKRKNGDEFPVMIGLRAIEGSDILVGHMRNVASIRERLKSLKE